jgi:VWFA-related protein
MPSVLLHTCVMRKAVISFVLFLFALAGISAAQTPNEQTALPDAGTTARLQVQSQLVFVPATVTVGKDEVLYELKASQFVVEDNGVPQQVRLDEGDEVRPLSLVVAVQCSRSAIAEFDKLHGLPAMLDAVIGGAPAEVAVMQFGTGEELLAGFTHDEETRNRALSRIAPCSDDGGANIFDAVDYANTILEAHKATGRRAVLLISETRDHGSETKPQTVIEELGRSNTIVDAASFAPERDEMVADLKYGGGGGLLPLVLAAVQAARKNAPKEFAQLSGGEYINFRTQQVFDHGMDTFANHVHNSYLLSFVPHAAQAGAVAPGLHKITVKVPEYPKATIRYRESYWAAPAATTDLSPDAGK